MTDAELRERLADYAHSAWAGWMRYMFGKCHPGTSPLDNLDREPNGTLVIPAASVERWTRQMNTPYTDLPENEKESDRAEADEILALVNRRAADGWVSVEDALPEIWQEVIVTDGIRVTTDCINEISRRWKVQHYKWILWRPLPDPPEAAP